MEKSQVRLDHVPMKNVDSPLPHWMNVTKLKTGKIQGKKNPWIGGNVPNNPLIM